jgi:hypothetical protein
MMILILPKEHKLKSNSIAIRDPFSSDVAGSRCFEIDNYDKIENCDVTKKKLLLSPPITLPFSIHKKQSRTCKRHLLKTNAFNTNNSVIHGFLQLPF